MSYRTPLEARIAKKTTRAILDYGMIEDGDRVMVGLSGGKDSWALLQILSVLRERAPIDFSLVAVNVDSGYEGYQHELVARGVPSRAAGSSIGSARRLAKPSTQCSMRIRPPCSLCARLRRGVLYRVASELGATKIALGHHADDFVETLLLNTFLCRRAESDAGAARVGRPAARCDPAAGLCLGRRSARVCEGIANCR